MVIVPAGIYEENGTLITRFGMPLDSAGLTRLMDADRNQVLEQVMRGIAACLPHELRGFYT